MEFEHKFYLKKDLNDCTIHEIYNGIVCIREKPDSSWLYFAVMYNSSSGDECKSYWIGEGIGYPLRECRHSWFADIPNQWEDDQEEKMGYISYINGRQIK